MSPNLYTTVIMLTKLCCITTAFITKEAAAATYPTYPIATHPNDLQFLLQGNTSTTTDKGYAVHSQTFQSPPMPLAPGEVVFTDPKKTFLDMPKGVVAILGYHAQVVDGDGNSVPLSEVYNHHWLVFDGRGNAGVCSGFLDYKFGVGAESRNTPVQFPDGYGLVTNGHERWAANIHLLRTVDLVGDGKGVKDCIECRYAPNRGCDEKKDGTFACCQDGSFCETNGGDKTKKTYYLQYTVEWTDDVSKIKPVSIYVLDASNCDIEFNIEENKDNVVVTQFDWRIPGQGDVVMAVGHQHVGGYNISMLMGKEKSSLKNICTSTATYGTGNSTTAGNEKGYLVGMSVCNFNSNDTSAPASALPFEKGDVLRVKSLYSVDPTDQRSDPLPGGAHGGVMALFYVVTHEPGRNDNLHGHWSPYWLFSLLLFIPLGIGLYMCCCRKKQNEYMDSLQQPNGYNPDGYAPPESYRD